MVAQVQSAAEQLLQRLQDANLPGLLDNIIGLVADLRGQVRDGDLATTLKEAAALLGSLRNQTEAAQVPETLAELRGVATDARALLGSRDVQRMLANAAAAAAELRTVLARLPASLNSLEGGLRTARGATTDLQAELAPILRDLRAAVGNLRDTTEQLRRYPSQAIFGAPPPAPELDADDPSSPHPPPGPPRRPAAGRRPARCLQRPAEPALPGGAALRPGARAAAAGDGTAQCPGAAGADPRAAPGMDVRGLRLVGADGQVSTGYWQEWAAPPAELAEEALRRWLAASGRFSAVTLPGSRLRANYVLEGELIRLQAEPARRASAGRRCRCCC